MDLEILRRLEMLNELRLTDAQKQDFLEFYEKREKGLSNLNEIDTQNVERMVHVMPLETVVREDKAVQLFDRDQLQKGAPDTDEGYWCVPKVVE